MFGQFSDIPPFRTIYGTEHCLILGHWTDSPDFFSSETGTTIFAIVSLLAAPRTQRIEHIWWFWTSQLWKQSYTDGLSDHPVNIPHKINQIYSATRVIQPRKWVSQGIFGGVINCSKPHADGQPLSSILKLKMINDCSPWALVTYRSKSQGNVNWGTILRVSSFWYESGNFCTIHGFSSALVGMTTSQKQSNTCCALSLWNKCASAITRICNIQSHYMKISCVTLSQWPTHIPHEAKITGDVPEFKP